MADELMVVLPEGLSEPTQLSIVRFAEAIADKMLLAEKKYGFKDEWLRNDWEPLCRAAMFEHITKGDPLDVAIYCFFMWHHGWRTG